jgi:hypothetical protein
MMVMMAGSARCAIQAAAGAGSAAAIEGGGIKYFSAPA